LPVSILVRAGWKDSERMDDRFNTIAGWALFAGIVALGGGIVSSKMFHSERPEKMGYAIEGVEAEGGAASEGPPFATLLASADVAAGEKVFGKCAACHSVTQGGANGVGPNLYGVVGEAIASPHRAFAFSDALKSKGGAWTFDSLNEWLKSPRAFAPGTKMTFAGLGNAQDRANVVAYLNAQGSNLPLPAAGAAAPEGAANASNATVTPAEAANAATTPAAGQTVGGKAPSQGATSGGPATPGHGG
jgi:cytochrome c